MYCANERARLARSVPPELTKRVKLLRGTVNLSAGALGGIGGRSGGAGTGVGGRWLGGGTSGGTGRGAAGDGLPPPVSQLGMSGLSPPWPPFAFEVPTNASGLGVAYAEWR